MDEVFDYFKRFKRKHKYFLLSLVIAEFIFIFFLAIYFKGSLVAGLFSTEPKAFLISSYDPTKRYLISQGDFLFGKKALPNSKILVLITPGKFKQTIQADSKGEFKFQIPHNTDKGRLRVTFANFDGLKNVAWIKSYKITVESNSILNPVLKKIGLKKVLANETESDR